MPFVSEDTVLHRCEGCVKKWRPFDWKTLPQTSPSNFKRCSICWKFDVTLYETVGGGWN